MEYITGRTLAEMKGYSDHKSWVRGTLKQLNRKTPGYDYKMVEEIAGDPVYAFIDVGRWSARCPDCNGSEYVDPDDPEPVFYCFSCGNEKNGGRWRPVIVPSPEDRAKIEAELNKRPVEPGIGPSRLHKVINEKPLIFISGRGALARSWEPYESVEDLRKQNEIIKKVDRGRVGDSALPVQRCRFCKLPVPPPARGGVQRCGRCGSELMEEIKK